jgi:hypothetical protein
MSDDIKLKLHFIFHAHQSMKGRSGFDLEVTAVDAEFSLRPQIISGRAYLNRNRDGAGHAVVGLESQLLGERSIWVAMSGEF